MKTIEETQKENEYEEDTKQGTNINCTPEGKMKRTVIL
jgi:hypothetical protein